MESGTSFSVKAGLLSGLQIKETAVILTLSVLTPFLIHFLPDFNGIVVGAIFLPMFWAPYLGVKLFKFHVGLIAGLAAPLVNYLITGNPHSGIIPLITLQLALFVVIAGLLKSISFLKYFNALVAYTAAILLTSLVLMAFPVLMPNLILGNYFAAAFISGIPGIILLVIINYISVKYNKE